MTGRPPTGDASPTLRLATRSSPLAVWQAEDTVRRLCAAHRHLQVTLVPVRTAGDLRQDRQVWELGGQGIFVKEVQAAVLDGRADVAVHSAKDLPSVSTPGLDLVAFPVRADPRDALVGASLTALAPGATVATGSVRRRAQLAALRPDLAFVGLRGSIATRLEKVPEGGAVVVARAALDRLGLGGSAAETFDETVLVPQVGQGAIAVECRSDDGDTARLLGAIDDPAVAVAVRAERAFLAHLGGGCDLPVGAHARLDGGSIQVEGLIAAPDGTTLVRARRHGPVEDAELLGDALGAFLLGEIGGAAGPLGAPGPLSPTPER